MPFAPDPTSARGELLARFHIVLTGAGRPSRADDEYGMVTRARR